MFGRDHRRHRAVVGVRRATLRSVHGPILKDAGRDNTCSFALNSSNSASATARGIGSKTSHWGTAEGLMAACDRGKGPRVCN